MITLNYAFKRELTQEDEGYESGSESLNIPTLSGLRIESRIYYVSTNGNISLALPHHSLWLHSTQTTPIEATAPCAAT